MRRVHSAPKANRVKDRLISDIFPVSPAQLTAFAMHYQSEYREGKPLKAFVRKGTFNDIKIRIIPISDSQFAIVGQGKNSLLKKCQGGYVQFSRICTIEANQSVHLSGNRLIKIINQSQGESAAKFEAKTKHEYEMSAKVLGSHFFSLQNKAKSQGKGNVLLEACFDQPYVKGKTLHAILKNQCQYSYSSILKIAYAMARCLLKLQNLGISHNDFHSKNIIIWSETFELDREARKINGLYELKNVTARVVDFALSVQIPKGDELRDFASRHLLLSPPEALYNITSLKTDPYAFGCLLLALFGGHVVNPAKELGKSSFDWRGFWQCPPTEVITRTGWHWEKEISRMIAGCLDSNRKARMDAHGLVEMFKQTMPGGKIKILDREPDKAEILAVEDFKYYILYKKSGEANRYLGFCNSKGQYVEVTFG